MIVPTLSFLLESHHVWVVFTVAVLIFCCMFEELWYQHPHPFCIICILDGLLNQKLYDPLFFVLEEFFYIPLGLILEDLLDILWHFVESVFPIVARNDRWNPCII